MSETTKNNLKQSNKNNMENNVENKVENNQDTISAKSQTNLLGYAIQPLAQDKVKKEVILTNGKEKIKYSLIRGEENRIFTGTSYPTFNITLSLEVDGQWEKISETRKEEKMKYFSGFIAEKIKLNGKANFQIIETNGRKFVIKYDEKIEKNNGIFENLPRYSVSLNFTSYYLVFQDNHFWIDCEFPFFGIGVMNAFPYTDALNEDIGKKLKEIIGLE